MFNSFEVDSLIGRMDGWLVGLVWFGCLVTWLFGWLVGWLVGWLDSRLVDWLVGRSIGCLR